MGSRSCLRSSNTTRSWCLSFFSASGLLCLPRSLWRQQVRSTVFWAEYHAEIVRGWANIPTGPYNTDLFAAKNLPFLIGLLVENAAAPSRFGAALGWVVTGGLYGGLAGAALAICRRLSRFAELRAAIAELPDGERVLMVIGSAVIAGCFFAGQSIGYRGIFLLLVMPGLLALSRSAVRELRALCLGSAIVIVLLMWGECLRQALDGGFGFWLLRELGWWWSVSVMLALVADFLRESPVLQAASAWFGRQPVARGDRPGSRGSAARAWAARRPRTAILLEARAAQAGQTVLLEGALPRPVLLLGQLVTLQRLFEGDALGTQRTYSAATRPKFWNITLTQVAAFLLLDHLVPRDSTYDAPLAEAVSREPVSTRQIPR